MEKPAGGQEFRVINDHDPKPLYYQFDAEQTGKFTWEYLESGLETWRVRIGKTADAKAGRRTTPPTAVLRSSKRLSKSGIPNKHG